MALRTLAPQDRQLVPEGRRTGGGSSKILWRSAAAQHRRTEGAKLYTSTSFHGR